MSDPGVRSGGDDFLAGCDFDGAGAVSVFLEDEKDVKKPSATKASPSMTIASGTLDQAKR